MICVVIDDHFLQRNSMGASPSINQKKQISRPRLISIEDVFSPIFKENYLVDSNPLRFSQLNLESSIGMKGQRQMIAISKSEEIRKLIRNAFNSNFLFSSLSSNHLEKLIDVCSHVKCNKDEFVIKEGFQHDFMYVVESGSLEVSKKNQGKIDRFSAGDSFGDIGLLYGGIKHVTVQCIEEASLWALDRESFRHFLAFSELKRNSFATQILAKVPLFQDLQISQLEKVAEMGVVAEYLEGDIIMRHGETSSVFYIILDGMVNTSSECLPDDEPCCSSQSNTANPNKLVLPPGGERLKSGDWFGEDNLVGKTNDLNVVADCAISLLVFDRDTLEKVLGSFQHILERKADNEMLLQLPFIQQLPEQKREMAIHMFTLETYSDLDVITSYGAKNTKFVVIKTGRVFVSSSNNNNDNVDDQGDPKARMKVEQEPVLASRCVSTRVTTFEADDDQELETFLTNFTLNNPENGHGKERMLYQQSHGEDESSILDQSSELGPGQCFGGDAVMKGTAMDCTAIANGKTTCLVFTKDDLTVLFLDNEGDVDLSNDFTARSLAAEQNVTESERDEERLWSSLKNLGCLGKGNFGSVHMVQDSKNQNTYALKVVNRQRVKTLDMENRRLREIQFISHADHPLICRFFGTNEDDQNYYMLLELLQGGELRRLIHPKDPKKRALQFEAVNSGKLGGIPHEPAKFYIAALSLPLIYIHRRSVIYRDLKPENIMIDRFGYPKLIDFGLSKRLNLSVGEKTFTLCGTAEYLAPEMISGRGHGQAVDWWALGVVLYEMIVGKTPFQKSIGISDNPDEMSIYENISEHNLRFPDAMEPYCVDLIQRLLTQKPLMRMCSGTRSHKEFEDHEWFQNQISNHKQSSIDWLSLESCEIRPPWIPNLDDQTDRNFFDKRATNLDILS